MKKVLIILLVILVFVFTACNSSAPASDTSGDSSGGGSTSSDQSGSSSGSGDSKGKIAVLNFVNAHPYFQSAKVGGQRACDELGYEFIFDGPADVDTPRFLSMIEDYANQGVDAMIIASLDDSSAPVMRAAMEKGVKMITWDCDLPTAKDARDAYACFTFDLIQYVGSGAAEGLALHIGTEGKFVLIDGDPAMQVTAEYANAFLNYIADKYPGLEMLGREPGAEDPQKCYTVAQNLLTAYPEAECIVVLTSSASATACKAVEEAGLVGKVWVTGESFPDIAGPAYETGATKGFYSWDTADWLDFAVHVAVSLVEGKDVPDGNTGQFFPKWKDSSKEGDQFASNAELVFITKDGVKTLTEMQEQYN